MWKAVKSVLLSGSVLLAASGPVASQGDFYKGRKIDVLIGYAAGGTYDTTARLLSRHMPRYIPGAPTMIPQNLPGSGSIKATVSARAGSPALISRATVSRKIFLNSS